MKWVERIAWGLTLVGLVFRLLHWPFSGFLTVLGLSTASVVYFPLGWLLFGGASRKDQLLPLSLITGLVLGLTVIGILFKLQLWPGGEFNLMMGVAGCVVLAVATYGIHSRRRLAEHYFNALHFRLIAIGLAGLVLYLVPTATLIEASVGAGTERADLLIRLHEAPGDTAAQRALEELDRRGR